jgi:hypothetical protein
MAILEGGALAYERGTPVDPKPYTLTLKLEILYFTP